MEILYKNKKFITSITIKDRKMETRFLFVPEETKRSYFKQTTTPEHYVDRFFKNYITFSVSDILSYKYSTGDKMYTIENNIVYIKDKVEITYSDDSEFEYGFDSFDEAKEYVKDFIKENNLKNELIKIVL